MLDYLNALSSNDVQALDIEDAERWTVLYRVAAYGTSEEVLELIKEDARPEQFALPLRWHALHHAVSYGNVGTYKDLLPFFGDEVTIMVDERGWTLLHIAAFDGHDAIVRDLLSRGADRHCGPGHSCYICPSHCSSVHALRRMSPELKSRNENSSIYRR